MVDRATRITKETLVPIGLIITIVGAVWFVSANTTRATVQIEQHERRITSIEQDIKSISDGIHRIEVKLGTTPQVKP